MAKDLFLISVIFNQEPSTVACLGNWLTWSKSSPYRIVGFCSCLNIGLVWIRIESLFSLIHRHLALPLISHHSVYLSHLNQLPRSATHCLFLKICWVFHLAGIEHLAWHRHSGCLDQLELQTSLRGWEISHSCKNKWLITPLQKSVPPGRIFEGGFERKWPKKVHTGSENSESQKKWRIVVRT